MSEDSGIVIFSKAVIDFLVGAIFLYFIVFSFDMFVYAFGLSLIAFICVWSLKKIAIQYKKSINPVIADVIRVSDMFFYFGIVLVFIVNYLYGGMFGIYTLGAIFLLARLVLPVVIFQQHKAEFKKFGSLFIAPRLGVNSDEATKLKIQNERLKMVGQLKSHKNYKKFFNELDHFVVLPLSKKELKYTYNIKNCAILFHSKEKLNVQAIMAYLDSKIGDVSVFHIRARDILSQWSGEAPKNVNEIFETSEKYAPCVLLIDEIQDLSDDQHAAKELAMCIKDSRRRMKEIYVVAFDYDTKRMHSDLMSNNCFEKRINLK